MRRFVDRLLALVLGHPADDIEDTPIIGRRLDTYRIGGKEE